MASLIVRQVIKSKIANFFRILFLILMFIKCKNDDRRVAEIFVNHVLRFEYDKAAIYADDSTAAWLTRIQNRLDTAKSIIQEARRYKSSFSLQKLSVFKNETLFRWCCHHDRSVDSLIVFRSNGRWRVSWIPYVPPTENLEQADTVFMVIPLD